MSLIGARWMLLLATSTPLLSPPATTRAQDVASPASLEAALACRAGVEAKRAKGGADALGALAEAMERCRKMAEDSLRAETQSITLAPFLDEAREAIDTAQRRAADAARKASRAQGAAAPAADAAAAGAEDEVTKHRYAKGLELIQKMDGSARSVRFITMTLKMESLLSRATSPWRDDDLRDTWDKVEGWGTSLGTIVGALGAALLAMEKAS